MIKSNLESLVKLPLQIPLETSIRSKKDPTSKSTTAVNKNTEKKNDEAATIEGEKKTEEIFSRGYIKYPSYDFF